MPGKEPEATARGTREPESWRNALSKPFFRGARHVTRARAIRDAFAGVNVAAMSMPQALGYARIAGAPVVTGLYTLLLPLVSVQAPMAAHQHLRGLFERSRALWRLLNRLGGLTGRHATRHVIHLRPSPRASPAAFSFLSQS
jgi:hypothetical protein